MFYFQFDHTFFINLRMSRMPAILQVRDRVKGEKKELLRICGMVTHVFVFVCMA